MHAPNSEKLAEERASPTKTCTRCSAVLPRDGEHFYASKRTGKTATLLSSACKECTRKYLRNNHRKLHEKARKQGDRAKWSKARRERDPIGEKIRCSKHQNFERSRIIQPWQRLARKLHPDEKRCEKCARGDVKTRLWFTCGPMVPYRCATKRLCGKCWGDELSILAHAQYDYRHLFA